MKRRSGFGWLEFVEGILLMALGFFSMFQPENTLTGFVLVYGALAIVTGVGDLIFYIKIERHTGFAPTVSLIMGLLSVMTGFMLLVYPGAGRWILALLFPIWFIAHCLSRLSHLNLIRIVAGRAFYAFTLALNSLGLALGVLMIFQPRLSFLAAGLVIGAYLVLLGLDDIALAFSRMGSDW